MITDITHIQLLHDIVHNWYICMQLLYIYIYNTTLLHIHLLVLHITVTIVTHMYNLQYTTYMYATVTRFCYA